MEERTLNPKYNKCWICEDIANSGEHIIKQSDLKQIFPKTSQQHPIYTQKKWRVTKTDYW